MGFIGFLILGLIAGAIAKAILPGKQGGGWIATLILGVVGAWLGGLIGGLIFGFNTIGTFFEIRTWITAIVGSIIVLLIWGAIMHRRRA
ncbi:GlsB/YeaQ/YmgE family stress response membrane protein [Sinomonas sp.]|uniref:GlsB/YeaQ/YmgE family stress response membrane protein n=1 Tax=Sinomonas sp. TaxID=1914986 RepID=UPI002FE3624F